MEKIDCNCKNCNSPVDGKFCSNCGQAAKTGRIDLHYLIHEIQHSLLHVDKGIFYTIKELAIHPGKTIKEYLAGKRVNHFKPIAFVLILGTIYGFVTLFFDFFPETEINKTFADGTGTDISTINITNRWVNSHYSMLMLLFIPFAALSSFLVFRKKGYNYFEHLIIHAYITGMQILILLLIYPINYHFYSHGLFLSTVLILYVYIFWILISIFRRNSWMEVILKSILSLILGFFMLLVSCTFLAFFLIAFGIIKVE